jgi:cytochrome c-type biogenesis protein CcmH
MNRLCAALAIFFVGSALAVEPSERLQDPAQEARAREVSKALRCVVCQNESIDDSNAELAKDMRILVRERIASGDSNQAVLDYMLARYGDFVLLKPRLQATTIALWTAPFFILAFGVWTVTRTLRRRAVGGPAALDADEKRALARLMGGTEP